MIISNSSCLCVCFYLCFYFISDTKSAEDNYLSRRSPVVSKCRAPICWVTVGHRRAVPWGPSPTRPRSRHWHIVNDDDATPNHPSTTPSSQRILVLSVVIVVTCRYLDFKRFISVKGFLCDYVYRILSARGNLLCLSSDANRQEFFYFSYSIVISIVSVMFIAYLAVLFIQAAFYFLINVHLIKL